MVTSCVPGDRGIAGRFLIFLGVVVFFGFPMSFLRASEDRSFFLWCFTTSTLPSMLH